MTADVRWQQRFSNFCRALEQLEGFFEPPELNDREQQGLIKAFEYCFELGWNTLREAYRLGLLSDGEAWMLMIQDRNLTAHTYNRATAESIAGNSRERHRPCFHQLRERLQERQQQEQGLS